MPGEVTQASGAIAHPVTMQNSDDEIAHGGHGLWSGTAPDTAGIFAKRCISHIVQFIFDGPVPPAQAEQVRGPGSLRRQAGDLAVHLGAPAPLALALVHEPTHLCEARPHDPGVIEASSGVEGADSDTPVPAINRPGARRGLDHLERNAAAPAGVPADCP